MEFYGLFLGINAGGYFIKLQPTITGTTGNLDLDSNNLIDMDAYVATIDVAQPQSAGVVAAATATNSDNSDSYRFHQAKGFLTKHRPCYMVTEAEPTQVNRVTTEQKELIPKLDTGTVTYTDVDLYETFE